MTRTPEQLDALADAMNTALNNHHHEDQCACDAWPAACLAPLGRYRMGEWDTSAFAIALPLVWDEIAKVANADLIADNARLRAELDDERGSHAMTAENASDVYRDLHAAHEGAVSDLDRARSLIARYTCDCCGRIGQVRSMAGIRLCVGNTTGLGGPCPRADEVTA